MSTHKIAFPHAFGSSTDRTSGAIDRAIIIKLFRILLICAVISLAVAFTAMYLSKPAYQITSNFSISSPGFNQGSALNISDAEVNRDAQEQVNAEVAFLTSKSNLLGIVQKFNLSVTYKKAGFFNHKDLYLESPVNFLRVRMGASSSGHFSLTLKNQESFLLDRGKGKAQEYAFNTTYTDELGSWQISKTPTFAQFIGDKIRIDVIDPELATSNLQNSLNVSQTGKPATVLKVSTIDPVLARGYDVLNALLISYLEHNQIEKEMLAQSQLRFIDKQLNDLNLELTRINRELEGLTGTNGQAAHSAKVNRFLSQVKTNDQLLNRISLKISGLATLKNQLQSQRIAAVDSLNTAVSDPLLNAMVRTFYETKSSYKRLLQTHLSDDPEASGTLQQLQRQKKSLLEEIDSNLSPMLKEQANLIAANAVYANRISELPAQELKHIELKRQLQVIPQLYADLVKSKENAALNHASYLAFSKPLNSKMMLRERRHLNFFVLLIAFSIPACFFLGKEILILKQKPHLNN